MCLLSLFWLPFFGKDFSPNKQIEGKNANSNKNSITSQAEQTSEFHNLNKDDYIQVLKNVRGLGEKKLQALLEAYPDAQNFLEATDEDIFYKTKSLVGKSTAKKIRNLLIDKTKS